MSSYFNGTTSYSYRSSFWPSAVVPLTFSCWINPSTQASAAARGLVSVRLSSATAANRDCVRIIVDTTGAIVAQAADSAGANNSTTTNLVKDNQWNHCVGVFLSTTSRTAWLNGVAATTNTNSRTITVSANQLGIGASLYNSLSSIDQFFSGAIAHVAIWDEALSAGEIGQLSKGTHPQKIRVDALRYYNPLINQVSAPAETIVDRSWASFNKAKHPYQNGESPLAQVFVNILDVPDSPYILDFPKPKKISLYMPAAGNNAPIFYHQRQQQGMAA